MNAEDNPLDGVYNFPPFFTLQPNETTRRKQFGLWKDVLISNRVFMITKSNPVFHNLKINRTFEIVPVSNGA